MLELVTIFLVTLLIAMVTIWLYRTMSGWHGSSSAVVERRKKSAGMKLKPQSGFIALMKPFRQDVKTVKLRNTGGTIKAPWGW